MIRLTFDQFFKSLKGTPCVWVFYEEFYLYNFVATVKEIDQYNTTLEIEFEEDKQTMFILTDKIGDIEEEDCGDRVNFKVFLKDNATRRIDVSISKMALTSEEQYVEDKKREYIEKKEDQGEIVNILELKGLTEQWKQEYQKEIDAFYESLT